MSFDRCVISLSLGGKLPINELRDNARVYEQRGMDREAALERAVEDRLEMALMEESAIVKAVRGQYEAKGGKRKPAPAAATAQAVPTTEPATSEAPPAAAVSRLEVPRQVANWELGNRQAWQAQWAALKNRVRDGLVTDADAARVKSIAAGRQADAPKALERLVAEIKKRQRANDAQEASQESDDAPRQSSATRAGQTDTPAFKRWFGDSKVVDESGAPLVVYHGTGADTGPEFLPGTYFTARPDVAEIYANAPTRQVAGGAPNVTPAYMSLKNPYIHDDIGTGENLSHAVLGRRGKLEQVREKLMSDGYDGIIIKNYLDLGGVQDQYVAFRPEQIKSAIGNTGDFDPNNADIRASEAPPSAGMAAADVTKATARLRAKWLGFNRIDIVQSVADLPTDLQERSKADQNTEGLYDPRTNRVYLIADNLSSPERAAFVAAHEVIGHGGLTMLRDKSVIEALKFASGNRLVKELAVAIQDDRDGIAAHVAVEEAIAELSAALETGDYAGLEQRYGVTIPDSAKSGLKASIARLLDAIKRFIASITGQPVDRVSDADVRAMLRQQQAAVEGGESAAATSTPAQGAEAAMASEVPAEPRASRAPTKGEEVVPKWAENLTPEQKAALRKSGAIYEEKTMKQKVAELKEGAAKKLQYGILDQFAPIKDKIGKIPYILARMAKNADGTLEALMLYGRPHLDADGGMLVDTTKKGFIETMQALNGEHDRFFSWLAGRRAEQLKKEGRENLFTDEDISALATLNQGKMKDGTSREAAYLKAQKDVAEMNKSVLDIAEKSGLIDGESRKVWASDFYVPFYRVMEEGITGPSIKSGLVNQKSIKKLKGGTNNLGDLTQNMLMNWSTLLTASAKNRAAKATLDAAKDMGIATEAPEATIRQMGKAANTKAVSYMENGVNRWHVVEDDDLLAAISALEFSGYNNQAMKAMTWFKNALTKAVTSLPGFKVRNLIRDSLSSIAVSNASYNPLANLKNGYSLLRNKDQMAQMVAGGGIFRFGSYMEGNRGEHVKNLIESGIRDDTILNTAEKMQRFLGKLWDGYQKVGDLSENLNRAALYKKRRAEGASHLEASFEARDLMDFGLSGAWAGVRALNQILPFFNARLQGMYKLGRGYNDDPKRMGYVVGAVALASVALMLAYKDDEDFKKRTDADRANYWWFKVGDTAYRIPKPFEIGAAGSAIESLVSLLADPENTDSDRVLRQLGELINGQLAMNPIPQVFRPVIDVYANKDAFSGRPIESLAMQKLRPEDRYTYNTSELARVLSKSGVFVDPISLVSGTGVKQLSPVQIDSLIRGYFSGVGTLATAAVDGLLHHSVIDRGEALPLTLKQMTSNFASELPENGSRYVDMLYSTATDIEQTYASYRNAIKNGDIEKARAIQRDEGEKLAKYHLVESLKKNEARLTQQIQRVINSKELTGEQKEIQVRRLRAEQDRIARVLATRG